LKLNLAFLFYHFINSTDTNDDFNRRCTTVPEASYDDINLSIAVSDFYKKNAQTGMSMQCFNTPNFPLVMSYNPTFRDTVVSDIVKPILKSVLQKSGCDAHVQESICRHIEPSCGGFKIHHKPVKGSEFIGCPLGDSACAWCFSMPKIYLNELPVAHKYQVNKQSRSWLEWDSNCIDFFSRKVVHMQRESKNYSVKKMLAKLDKHWDLLHSHIRKPRCLQTLPNVEREIKRRALEDARITKAGKQRAKKKTGNTPKSARKMKK